MKAIVVILAGMSCFVGCASNGSGQQVVRDDANGVVNHADPQHGLKLTYGGGWKEQRLIRPRGAVLVLIGDESAPGLPPTVTLSAQPKRPDGSPPADLAEVEQNLVGRLQRQIDEFQLVRTSDTTLGGEPARRIEYTGRKAGMQMHVLNVITIHDGRGFAFAYMADPASYDAHRADVERIIESIEWMN